jgi:hypothetical protein
MSNKITTEEKTVLENLSIPPSQAAKMIGRPDKSGAQFVSNYRNRNIKNKPKKIKGTAKTPKSQTDNSNKDSIEILPIVGYINNVSIRISTHLFENSIKEIIILTKDSFSVNFKDGDKRIYGFE